MKTICLNCGAKYEDHRGHDAACPYPYRFDMGQPLYIEGTCFRPAFPPTCDALVVRMVEDMGHLCGKRCAPGTYLCPEHMEN